MCPTRIGQKIMIITRYGDVTPLNETEINGVSDDIVYGNYQFGVMREGTFVPKYIGRSVSGLKTEIRQQWTNKVVNGNKRYTHFRYKKVGTIKAAYEQECRDFHGQADLDNIYHPAIPAGTDYKCPVCGE